MAGIKLDGAGQAKMKTLDEAMQALMRVHSLVEQYALQVKRNMNGAHFLSGVKRQLPALTSMLKGQFGMIADQCLQVHLASSRGASEAVRIRNLREGMAHIKTSLEIAITQTITKHAEKSEKSETEETA